MKVQNVRVEEGLTYAEALKKVEQTTTTNENRGESPQKMKDCREKN